jgi:hypothetical protein
MKRTLVEALEETLPKDAIVEALQEALPQRVIAEAFKEGLGLFSQGIELGDQNVI